MTFDKLINHLKLDRNEFLFQFNSHPHYPSALAFSDTLNFLDVKNEAYELDKQYWDELPDEFITVINNSFSLVKKTKKGYTVYSDKINAISRQELHNQSSDFVLLFEKTEYPVSSNYFSSVTALMYIILGVVLLYSLIHLAWYESVFNLLSIVGLYVSFEIFAQKFGSTSVVVKNICGQGANSSSDSHESSCNRIITKDKTNILGLKFADFSLIYFISLSLLGVFFPVTSFVIKGLSLLSVIAIGYSLYVQIFVERIFCRICILIISLLLVQLALSFLFLNFFFINGKTIMLSFLLCLIVFSFISYLDGLLKEKDTLQKSNAKNLRFKRNYDLFKRELLNHERVAFTDRQTFSVGNQNAQLHISIISNPYCGFCKEAHSILESLLNKYPDDISVQIRFNYFLEGSHEKFTGLISDFMYIYKNFSQSEFLEAVHLWFETRNESVIHETAGKPTNSEDVTVLIKMSEENYNAGFNFTPQFLINGYPFPEEYDREDIFYFIDELLEDENI